MKAIELRPISHGSYVASDADVISCTYNMDGFTPMNSVLVAHLRIPTMLTNQSSNVTNQSNSIDQRRS
jgi:hypothetical protein